MMFNVLSTINSITFFSVSESLHEQMSDHQKAQPEKSHIAR